MLVLVIVNELVDLVQLSLDTLHFAIHSRLLLGNGFELRHEVLLFCFEFLQSSIKFTLVEQALLIRQDAPACYPQTPERPQEVPRWLHPGTALPCSLHCGALFGAAARVSGVRMSTVISQ